MGNRWSRIGHGMSAHEAKDSAVSYIFASGYVVKQEARAQVEPLRVFIQIEGYGWHECTLEQTTPSLNPATVGLPSTFIASLVYFAQTEEELREKLNNVQLELKSWRTDEKHSKEI